MAVSSSLADWGYDNGVWRRLGARRFLVLRQQMYSGLLISASVSIGFAYGCEGKVVRLDRRLDTWYGPFF